MAGKRDSLFSFRSRSINFRALAGNAHTGGAAVDLSPEFTGVAWLEDALRCLMAVLMNSDPFSIDDNNSQRYPLFRSLYTKIRTLSG